MTKMVYVRKVWDVVVEIYKNDKAYFSARELPHNELTSFCKMPKADAIRQIREHIWKRQGGHCVNCSTLLTWAGLHLHEKLHRGQGGTYSLENDEGLCADCHLRIMHPEKQLNFGKKVE